MSAGEERLISVALVDMPDGMLGHVLTSLALSGIAPEWEPFDGGVRTRMTVGQARELHERCFTLPCTVLLNTLPLS